MRKSLIVATALGLVACFFALGPALADGPSSTAEDFSLSAVDGSTHTLEQYRGSYVVLEWINFGCPFVRKHYDGGHMQALQERWTGQGVVWLSICSSAPGKQGHYADHEALAAVLEEKGYNGSAYLLDEDGSVGRSYGARTTPHMFVIGPEGNFLYQGAIDSVRSADSADIEGATNYVEEALRQAMAGEEISVGESRPYGCGVKYKD